MRCALCYTITNAMFLFFFIHLSTDTFNYNFFFNGYNESHTHTLTLHNGYILTMENTRTLLIFTLAVFMRVICKTKLYLTNI